MADYTNQLKIKLYKKVVSLSPIAGMTIKIYLNGNEKLGLPHLVEHLLINQEFIPDYIQIDGSTNNDFISLKIIGNKEGFVEFIEKFLNQLSQFKIDNQKLEKEKSIVIQEMKQYGASNFEKFATLARSIGFDSSNLLKDKVLGNKDVINNYEVKDIYAFLKMHLRVNNLSIFISGDEEIIRKLEENIKKLKITVNPLQLKNNKIREKINKGIYIIGKPKKISKISLIYKLYSDDLTKDRIITLSLLFSILNNGKYSILKKLQKIIPELYFVQVFPVFRGKTVYMQIITSCNSYERNSILKHIDAIFSDITKLSYSTFTNEFKNVELQQNIMFDGVCNGVNSFARMQRQQEGIFKLDKIDRDKVIFMLKDILSQLASQQASIVIA